jgi:trehalose synthase
VDDTVPIEAGARRLDTYDADTVAQLREASAALQALRVLFITAAPFTPAAVDELRGVVPILRALGIEARWRALTDGVAGARAVGDALRGGETASADDPAIAAWRAQRVEPDADVVVACGPEALPALQAEGPRRMLRVHGRVGDGAAWELANGATVIAEDSAFVERPAEVIAPGVDPQSPRHLELPLRNIGHLARGAGLDLARPLTVAVFDLGGDALPEDAVDVWRAARRRGPADLQLALCARVTHNDERAWHAIGELSDYAADLEGVHIVADVAGHGDGVVNALQRLARAAIAVDLGWGLPTAEALLKGTPVVAPPGPATKALIGRGVTAAGERGQRLHALVEDPGLAAQQGRDGAVKVRERFLVTRVVRDLLGLLA